MDEENSLPFSSKKMISVAAWLLLLIALYDLARWAADVERGGDR